jgi:3-phenylpropionate/trans-cinnamate dioxygenase ferredoxin reductase subunit
MVPDPGMVIVGAGLAGGRAAQTLREEGYKGPVTLVGAESRAPYDRPPLSKAVLLKQKSVDECALFTAGFLRHQAIDLKLDTPAVKIDRHARQVLLADGESIAYRRLLLATGAEPRRLSVLGANLPGVAYLRTAEDAERLTTLLTPAKHIALIGGGFIGLEVAASAVAAGCKVTVIEAGERLLMRSVPRQIANRIELRHRAAGVAFRLGAQVAEITGQCSATGIRLADGEEIACDVVVVGIGAIPRTALAESAGLAVNDGVVVDDRLATIDPFIYAAGDVCCFPQPLLGKHIRLECWKGAEDQGRAAAKNMLGQDYRYADVPWFWSDQYELSIQMTGLPSAGSDIVVRELPQALLLFHLMRDGTLVGASGIGSATIGRDIRIAQMLIERKAKLACEQLSNPFFKLKALLSAPAVVA